MTNQISTNRRLILSCSIIGGLLFACLFYLTTNIETKSTSEISIYFKILLSLLTIILIAFDNYPPEKEHRFFSKLIIALLIAGPFLLLIFPFEHSFIIFLIAGYTYFTFGCYVYIKSTHSVLKIESYFLFYFISACFISIIFLFSRIPVFLEISNKKSFLFEIEMVIWLRFLFILGILSFIKAWTIDELWQFKPLSTADDYNKNLINDFFIGILYNIFFIKVFVNGVVYILSIISEFGIRTLFCCGLILVEIAKCLSTILAFLLILINTLCLVLIIYKLSVLIPLNIINGNEIMQAGKLLGFVMCGLLLCSFIKYIFLYGMQVDSDKGRFREKSIRSSLYLLLPIWFLTASVGLIFIFINKAPYSSYPFTLLFGAFVIIGSPIAIWSLIKTKNISYEKEVSSIPYVERVLNWKILFKELIPYLSLLTFIISIIFSFPKFYKNYISQFYNVLFESRVEINDSEDTNGNDYHSILKKSSKPLQRKIDTSKITAIKDDSNNAITVHIFKKDTIHGKLVRSNSKIVNIKINGKNIHDQSSAASKRFCNFSKPVNVKRKKYYPTYDINDAPISTNDNIDEPVYVSSLNGEMPNSYYQYYLPLYISDGNVPIATYTNCVDCEFKVLIGNTCYSVPYSNKKYPKIADLSVLHVEPTGDLMISIYNKDYSHSLKTEKLEIKENQCIVIGICAKLN